MWKRQLINPLKSAVMNFLQNDNVLVQQTRNTFILKRKHTPRLHKKNQRPHPLKSKYFVYEIVEDTEIKRAPMLDVILISFVEGVGTPGQILSLKPNYAYNKLLLPKLAVYASPENIAKYKHLLEKVDTTKADEYSSPFAKRTVSVLEGHVYSVVMNKDVPWVIEPWHIQASLRKGGVECPLEAITLPNQPIKGPDMNIQNKEFTATITINNKEKAQVRFRVHHWSTDSSNRLPYVFEYWKLPAEKLFENVAN